MRMKWVMLGLVLGLLPAAVAAAADERCTYRWVFYPPGGTTCQDGVQTKCVAGKWQATGSQCADDAGGPAGEETVPGVAEPRVKDPRVVEPGVGGVKPPSVPPVGN